MENGKAKKTIIVVLIILLILCLGVIVWQYLEVNNSIEQKDALDKNIQQQNTQINEKNTKVEEQEKIISEQDIKIKDLENKLNEKNAKVEELEKNVKEQKTKITDLNKELNSIKAGLKTRVSLKNANWRRADGKVFAGTFYFDNLENVEKIGISFSDGYEKIDAVEADTDDRSIYLVLDKSKKIGKVTVSILSEMYNNTHALLEVYYKDGRTETITTHFSLG